MGRFLRPGSSSRPGNSSSTLMSGTKPAGIRVGSQDRKDYTKGTAFPPPRRSRRRAGHPRADHRAPRKPNRYPGSGCISRALSFADARSPPLLLAPIFFELARGGRGYRIFALNRTMRTTRSVARISGSSRRSRPSSSSKSKAHRCTSPRRLRSPSKSARPASSRQGC